VTFERKTTEHGLKNTARHPWHVTN